MKTVNLTATQCTLEELLQLAASDAVRIVAGKGRVFILEALDDFDEEVKRLPKSKKITKFLNERSKQPATTSLAEYRKSLS